MVMESGVVSPARCPRHLPPSPPPASVLKRESIVEVSWASFTLEQSVVTTGNRSSASLRHHWPWDNRAQISSVGKMTSNKGGTAFGVRDKEAKTKAENTLTTFMTLFVKAKEKVCTKPSLTICAPIMLKSNLILTNFSNRVIMWIPFNSYFKLSKPSSDDLLTTSRM